MFRVSEEVIYIHAVIGVHGGGVSRGFVMEMREANAKQGGPRGENRRKEQLTM